MIPLATSGRTRIPGVNVPTMTELGLNVVLANWRGVFAPPGINESQRNALIDLMTRTVATSAWKNGLMLF